MYRGRPFASTRTLSVLPCTVAEAVCTVARLAGCCPPLVDPVAGRLAEAGDGVELPVATAALMPPMVAAAAMAIAVMTIRGCRTVPRFYFVDEAADPRSSSRCSAGAGLRRVGSA